MTTPVTLDHVGVVVPNLERARETFTRLGFQLTRQSSHKSALTPGGPVEEWGSGNRCAMFEAGYFEILGIIDPERPHTHVDERLARYAGLHLAALGCDDAVSLGRDLAARHKGVEPVLELHRDVPVGESDTKPGMFRIVYLDEALFPDAELFFIEHATPEVLWQPDLLRHPNGVSALNGATICTVDPMTTASRLEALVGATPQTGDGGGLSVVLRRGAIDLVDPAVLAKRFPGVTPPASPWFAAVHFRVAELANTGALLRANGVIVQESGEDALWVGPEDAEGGIVVFEAG